jgi:cobalt-zinc-cadmium efflux system protein
MSLAIAAVIVLGSWNLLKQSLHLMFDGVPEGVDLRAVQAVLEALPGVARVHDLHVWAMGTSEIAMTAHLVIPGGEADDAFLQEATRQLHDQFAIEHVTLQVMRVAFTRPCSGPDAPLCEPLPADERASSGGVDEQIHRHAHECRAQPHST